MRFNRFVSNENSHLGPLAPRLSAPGARGCRRNVCGPRRALQYLIAMWVLTMSLPTRAVIFYSTGDPSHNTTAPAGVLSGSGWQWQGRWGGLFATVVAPDFFLTAGHVGGGTGQAFQFQGQNYLAIASYFAPEADLRLWRVAGVMPTFAPRYTGTSEKTHGVVIFGVGTQRGEPVVVNQELKGWRWGPGDAVNRWGTNTVADIVDHDGQSVDEHQHQSTDQLLCTFDAEAGGDESIVSAGDSGGGMFLFDQGQWKLAGVNRAVEGNFRLTIDGPDFAAAIHDRGGLFEETSPFHWELIDDTSTNQPSVFLAARISSNESWIAKVLGGQVAPERSLTVESSEFVEGPYSAESRAELNAPKSQFFISTNGAKRFYRLRSIYGVTVRVAAMTDTSVTLDFGF